MTTERSTDISPLLEFKELLNCKLECNEKGRATNFAAWKKNVEFLLARIALSNKDMERAIMFSLTDEPQDWLDFYLFSFHKAYPDMELSAKYIIDRIQEVFYNDLMKTEAIQELFNSSTDLDGLESYNRAYIRARHLIDSMTKEQLLVHIYAKGLPESIRNQVLLEAHNHLDDAIRDAVQERAALRSLELKPSPSFQDKKSNRVSKSHSHKVTCKFYGKSGHHEGVCRFKSRANRVSPPPSFFATYMDENNKGP